MGPRIAHALATTNVDADVLAVHQLTVELAETISQASWLLFLDAREGGIAGTIHEERLAPEANLPASFSHHLNATQLLACAQAMFGRAPEAWLLSVTAKSFEFAEGLTVEVENAVPEFIERIRRRVMALTSGSEQ